MTYKKGYFIKPWAVRVILIALIALWMSTIFGFSAENGEQSQSLSDKITVQVVHILKSDYEDMDVKAKEEYFNTVSFFVRKTGHFGEYGILGVLISTFLLTFEKIRNKKRYIVILITTIIGMVYASSDEVHQNFVEGRSPKVMDVCIDTTGCFMGVVFVTIICFLICRRKRKKCGRII